VHNDAGQTPAKVPRATSPGYRLLTFPHHLVHIHIKAGLARRVVLKGFHEYRYLRGGRGERPGTVLLPFIEASRLVEAFKGITYIDRRIAGKPRISIG